MLIAKNAACRELWQRFLSRTGSGREGWLVEVREALVTEAACQSGAARGLLLARVLETFPKVRDLANMQPGVAEEEQRGGTLLQLRAARKSVVAVLNPTLVDVAHRQLRGQLERGSFVDDAASNQELLKKVEKLLLAKVKPFHESPEGFACRRLWEAVPSRVSMRTFTLIRRYGRGKFGQVFAARKEDTMAVFALKMMPVSYAVSKKGAQLLSMERQILAQAAHDGSPFLNSLRYAFRSGGWFVLVTPFCRGGTLQTRIDESTTSTSGLPVAEVTWITAQ
eukprot:4559435-Prymnesium_polylepis.1